MIIARQRTGAGPGDWRRLPPGGYGWAATRDARTALSPHVKAIPRCGSRRLPQAPLAMIMGIVPTNRTKQGQIP
ncbi:hypothetical protein GCM10009800_20130 [Nocardiopsis rhodophaea]